MKVPTSLLRPTWNWANPRLAVAFVLMMVSSLLTWNTFTAQAAEPVAVGYRDFSYAATSVSEPTGEKPESKLWWNDGFWWGSLFNKTTQAYHIYRLDLAKQDWVDTGTPLDDRNSSKADTLWDETNKKLYVVSHIYEEIGRPDASPDKQGRLYRYSYSTNTKKYTLDSGFPVTVTSGRSETLVLDKDSTGRLWVTWVESEVDQAGVPTRTRVMVNHSTTDDRTWGTPFELPVAGAGNLSTDDISSIIAFKVAPAASGRIGIMWSNRTDQKMYFAEHSDNEQPSQGWQSIGAYAPGGSAADDHINLKLYSGGTGEVFAAIKTSFTSSSAPAIVMLACIGGEGCTNPNSWQVDIIYQVRDDQTRPILLVDEENRKLHVFTASPQTGGAIYHKAADMDNIQFPAGQGEPFIRSSTDTKIYSPTSTKQSVNSTTGLVVLASDQTTQYYLHNYLSLQAQEHRVSLPMVMR